MARYKVGLTREGRDGLPARADRGSGAANETRRANILLAVDRGEFGEPRMTDEQAARACHSTPRTACNIRRRLVEEGFGATLARKRREGPSRRKVDGEAEARIVAPARADPPGGHARRAPRLIAEKSAGLGYVESISYVAVGDLPKTSYAHGWPGSGASRGTPAGSWPRRGTS